MQSAPTFLALVHFTVTMSGRRRRSLFPLFSPFSPKLDSSSFTAPPLETREFETLLPCRPSPYSQSTLHSVQCAYLVLKLKDIFFPRAKHKILSVSCDPLFYNIYSNSSPAIFFTLFTQFRRCRQSTRVDTRYTDIIGGGGGEKERATAASQAVSQPASKKGGKITAAVAVAPPSPRFAHFSVFLGVD